MARILVIGAGFGGLTTGLDVAAAGHSVSVLERASVPGGKARVLPTPAGPAEAGPTVLTQRWVFDAVFAAAGLSLEDHVRLVREPHLARHFWSDGSILDLWDDADRSAEAVRAWGGAQAEAEFRAVDGEAQRLWKAFEAPVVRAPRPNLDTMAWAAATRPRDLPALTQRLARRLGRLKERRLAQLFGRYATYVGGLPHRSPAILSLIWRAEAAGVWRVDGGLSALARAIADAIEARGGEVRCGSAVEAIEASRGRASAVRLADGDRLNADAVVFAGDPAALHAGLLGEPVRAAVRAIAVAPRSLSARVWAFAAHPSRADLVHHNVFFGDDPEAEFHRIEAGRPPEDPTLYVCAQDRGTGLAPPPLERFEIIENAAPWDGAEPEDPSCRTRMTTSLARFGLRFDPTPQSEAMTGPQEFARLFPASRGSLYGRSPHGALATLLRPTARSRVPGLYLAGGGCHPGAGVPMAALSGRHAAAAIESDLVSTSTCRPGATAGGTSTASLATGRRPSASSPS